MIRRTTLLTTACLIGTIACSAARAADPSFRIPVQDLGTALKAFAAQSGVAIIASADLVQGRRSGTAVGILSPSEALHRILHGSGLSVQMIGGAFVVQVDTSTSAAVDEDNEILVTGTRIRGAAPIGSPLMVVDRKAIEDSGRATISDYIQTLPQNFAGGPNEASYANNPNAGENSSYGSSINLRGLGAESTLVLFDGNRPALGGEGGSFVDTSLIPSTAIDRIEILTDGASAIYGTDAVAGVVNIRFRNKLDGMETQFYSGTADGAFTQVQLGQAGGKRWSTGGVMFAYQYDHRGRLPGSDRGVSTEDLTPFGGPDLRVPYTSPGNIIAADGSEYGIPAGQDGRSLTADQLVPGETHLLDRRKQIDLLPSQTTHSLYVAADQTIGDHISLYARALYAHRAFATSNSFAQLEPVTVPTTNPFYVDPIGTHEPVSVDYNFQPELGSYEQTGTVSDVNATAGATGRWGPWTIEAAGSYGQQIETWVTKNALSYTRVAIALADTDPATSLNVFGDGTANNPATIAYIRANSRQHDHYQVWSGSLRIDGPLFDLPAGTVKLAAGFEHRNERFSAAYDYNSASISPLDYINEPTPGTPGQRHIDAVYAELSIPLLSPEIASFPGKVDLSLAGRVDWYSDVGRTANPKAGLSWEPVKGLTLRSSFSTAFRAPAFFENAGASQNAYEPITISDPQSPSGQTAVLAILGYAPVVKPERAKSWTTGFDWKPALVPGLSLTASYFNIAYRDRIATPIADYPQFLLQRNIYGSLIDEQPSATAIAGYYASPFFVNPEGIAASDIGAVINLEVQNLSRVTVRGVDFDLNLARPLLGGTGSIGLSGTRLLTIAQRITANAPVNEVLGTTYNPSKLRLRGEVGWAKHGFDAHAFVNYTGGYSNTLAIPAEHVASWTTVDGQIGYQFEKASPLGGARLALSATNLLNRRPPYVLNSVPGQTLAYDPSAASAVGRLISVQATFSW